MLSRIINTGLLSALIFLSGSPQASAANLSISNTPLFLGTSVQPNVFFLLDDSGSMDWEILTNRHWTYSAYDPYYNNGSYGSSEVGWEVDDGIFYAWGDDGGWWSDDVHGWHYMYSQANAYTNVCRNSNGSAMERCTTKSPAEYDWRFRTPSLNVTFYNPDVNYRPWSGPCGSSDELCTDGDYQAAMNNPKICDTCANGTRDLATDGDTMNGPFKYDVWIDDSGYEDRTVMIAGEPVIISRPGRGDNFNETGVAAGDAPEPNGVVDLWDTHIRFSVEASEIEVSRISYAPRTTAEGSPGLNRTSTPLGTLSGGACYNILGSDDSVRAIHNQGATPDITATGGADCRTIAEVQTNIANWYQYSRRRMYTAKNAIGQVMDAQPKFRYGITKFRDRSSLFVEVPDVAVTNVSEHNFDLKDDLYADEQDNIGTYLVGGMDAVGRYFQNSLNGKGNPIKHSCQKNFQIVFTDGYWNDSISGYGDVDGDGNSNTGADLAYYFYKNDLNTNIPDNVIPDAGTEDDMDADGDGRTWQHLVSFTVAFGVQGNANMVDTDGDGWPNKDATGTLWPGDGEPVKSGNWGDPTSCSDCPDKVDDLWHMAYNTNGTYAAASSPEEVVDKLIAAINNIAGRVGSAAAVALNSGTLNANTRVYQAKFNSIDWSGDLESVPIKSAIEYDADGDVIPQPASCAGKALGEVCGLEWSASQKLESRTYSSRTIYTRNTDTDDIVAFEELSSLGATQQNRLRTNPDTIVLETADRGQDRLDWVRGRSTFAYDTGFRSRTMGTNGVKKLGDVIASSPEFVGAPEFLYSDSFESSAYSAYKATNKDRTKMVYVGANDGMLHAFRAADGYEEFAYIPGKLVNRLNNLTSPNYKKEHEYFVDGSPVAFDAFDGSWKTLLTTPTGAGGQTVFTLDVTDPDNFDNSDVLWEFDDSVDADLGYTMGDVSYAKMNNGEWAVIIGNGYNNTAADDNVSTTGNGVIYVLNAFTGEIIRKFDTEQGMTEDPLNPGSDRPNGVSTVSPIDVNGDLKADFLYAGDLFGNVWKIDVRSSTASSWDFAERESEQPKPLYKAVDGTGVAQPITAGVSIKRHPTNGSQMLVMFGTGKYFEVGDGVTSVDSQIQSFYSIWDDNTGTQYQRSQLLEHEILSEIDVDNDGVTDWRITTSEGDDLDYKLDWATHKGWFIDLRYSGGTEYGEQVVRKPLIRNNRVIFVTTVPDGDPCGYGGSSWIMEVDANTGNRLPSSPFDVNGDGVIDASDLLNYDSKDTAASGTRSREGIVATPGILNSPDGIERKYFSGTSGNIDVVRESIDDTYTRRQSWRQLR